MKKANLVFYLLSLLFLGFVLKGCQKDEAYTAINQYNEEINLFEGTWQTPDGTEEMTMQTNEENFISFQYSKANDIVLQGDTFYYDNLSNQQFIRCFLYRQNGPNLRFDVTLGEDSLRVIRQEFTEAFTLGSTFLKQ